MCNRISAMTMSLLFVLDFILVLPVTFEAIFLFDDGVTNYTNYNYFHLLDEKGIAIYVADVLNAYLLLLFLVIVAMFF